MERKTTLFITVFILFVCKVRRKLIFNYPLRTLFFSKIALIYLICYFWALGTDPDGGSIRYSISGPIFSVDRDTGLIRLRQELDREKQDTIEVIISITGELNQTQEFTYMQIVCEPFFSFFIYYVNGLAEVYLKIKMYVYLCLMTHVDRLRMYPKGKALHSFSINSINNNNNNNDVLRVTVNIYQNCVIFAARI